ncbi:SAM-dependent methyltransferase [Bordetella genomosp. 7]|uniref:SAM-dependent methyltransferase n=1 Tax=Bordetella genomosp. 7 TaxID=1416805 RepID=A0A261QV11_9BORD|nr:class I SAM-dependent methyltransferase [Bordetella genomosp. 7]OZI16564.1 SAM-dependent methyltransferase [Bordetella genomosp. 7]
MPAPALAVPVNRRALRHAMAALAATLAVAALPLQAAELVELDVPFVPTPEKAVARMLEMAAVGPQDTVFDLGSGDGRIAIAAVRDFRASSATGVDIDPQRVAEARANAKQAGVQDRVRFMEQDLFETDFSKATVVTMYLLPDVNIKLRPRILDELAPGTRIVSHAFTMGDWDSDQYQSVEGRSLYMWIVPARVAGTWRVAHPQGDITLQVAQLYQKLTVTARRHDAMLGVQQARLQGDRLELLLDDGGQPLRLVGRVRGDTIDAVAADGAEQGWQATRQAS